MYKLNIFRSIIRFLLLFLLLLNSDRRIADFRKPLLHFIFICKYFCFLGFTYLVYLYYFCRQRCACIQALSRRATDDGSLVAIGVDSGSCISAKSSLTGLRGYTGLRRCRSYLPRSMCGRFTCRHSSRLFNN